MIIASICVMLAAICMSIMDSVENEHIFDTVFNPSRMNSAFWYKRESHDKAKRFFGWKLDAWHLFKSFSIWFWAGAAIAYFYTHEPYLLFWWRPVVDLCILHAIWILVFNLFYNKIWKR